MTALWWLPLLAGPTPFFGIRVVDDASGRGVPCVELRTVHEVTLVTDNAGWAAFWEPELMGREVFFHLTAHGYELPEDRFGYRGARLTPKAGEVAEIRVRRTNLAERVGRLTGADLFRDSVLLGLPAPTRTPLPGGVMGQDSVIALPYRGRLHWFWGDTNRAGYPLGQFATSGAVTPPALDPEAGIAFDYFVDAAGFSRRMIPLEGPGVVWIDGVCVVPDAGGEPRMVCHFERREGLGRRYGHGLATWDDAAAEFRPVLHLPDDAPLWPRGQTFAVGDDWIYCALAYPLIRMPARYEALLDPTTWQSYTPLPAGGRWTDAATVTLERDAGGRLVWAWKPATEPVDAARQNELVAAGRMTRDESPFALVSPDGRAITAHHGSVRWNEYLGAWLMIVGESHGETSLLGDIHLAIAPAPEGPWRRAIRIVSHRDYSLYNPVQHAFLDRDGGRIIYFEGTYSRTFSGTQTPTPRYDYNQMLYRLDLSAALPRP